MVIKLLLLIILVICNLEDLNVPKTVFLFADSAIEPIPRELFNDEIIRKFALKKNKKPSEILLDSTYHHKPMKKLSNYKKRGRPDIIHFCLLNLVGSTFVLNNLTEIEIYVHTIDNKIIEIKPYTRLPKNIDRFKGLIVQLFKQKKIETDGNILLRVLENENLESVLNSIDPNNRFLFSSKGYEMDLEKVLEKNNAMDLAFIIGAFPHGNFSQQINCLTKNMASVFPESLNAWIVLNKIIFFRELTLK